MEIWRKPRTIKPVKGSPRSMVSYSTDIYGGKTSTFRAFQRQRLRRYLEAENAILHAQSFVLNGRTLTRADLSAVRAVIDDLIADGVTLTDDSDKFIPKTRRAVLFD